MPCNQLCLLRSHGVPRQLFVVRGLASNRLSTGFDVTSDGQRFLLNENSVLADTIPTIRVVVNWMTGLQP